MAEGVKFMPNSLNIVNSLIRALGHKIRTPLSIVQNELSYLSTILPKGEADRAQTACRGIVGILAGLSQGIEGEQSKIAILLNEFLKLNEQDFKVNCSPEAAEKIIFINSKSFIWALLALQDSIGCFGSASDAAGVPNCDCHNSSIKFSWKAKPQTAAKTSNNQSWESFSEYFCLTLHHDFVELPVADAIFLSHDCSSEVVQTENSIILNLVVPVVA